MSKKSNLKPIAAALGATFAVSLAVSPAASAGDNPFGMTELSKGGYMIAASHGEGGCGEGKCGEGMKEGEGKCGEGKCGEGKAMTLDECKAKMKKMKAKMKKMKGGEGKCGEGKCGEGMKESEGKCGEGKCGDH